MSTASIHTLRLILAGWTARGGSVTELLAAIGVEPQQMLDPDGRVPGDVARRAWHVAAERCGDPHFGLSVSALVQPLEFGALGYALYSSATLGEALRRFSTFFRLVQQHATLMVIEEPEVARIRLLVSGVEDPADLRHPTECLLAGLVDRGHFTAGQLLPVLAVSFRHPAPEETSAHERAFGVVPRFSQIHNELVVPRAVLDFPRRSSAPALIPTMERHLAQLLRDLPSDETFLGRVRRVLAEELKRGEPTLERISARLSMSGRSLQRRLQDEGSAYQQLLDELRCELARRHVAEQRESVAEIAFLLGFSEVSAFHRAFKRWTGLTPRAYRQKSVLPA
jgi:AraC-like DNA-binding protein